MTLQESTILSMFTYRVFKFLVNSSVHCNTLCYKLRKHRVFFIIQYLCNSICAVVKYLNSNQFVIAGSLVL